MGSKSINYSKLGFAFGFHCIALSEILIGKDNTQAYAVDFRWIFAVNYGFTIIQPCAIYEQRRGFSS